MATGSDVGIAFVLAPVQTVEKLGHVLVMHDVLLLTVDDDGVVRPT